MNKLIFFILTFFISLPLFSVNNFKNHHTDRYNQQIFEPSGGEIVSRVERFYSTENLVIKNSGETEKEIQSKITQVTVFLQGAQITREAEAQLSAGKTILKLTGISPYIDERSIQVKGEGEFTILSVNHKKDFLKSMEDTPEVKDLLKKIEDLERKTEDEKILLEILKEKESFLITNKNIGGRDEAIQAENFRQLYDLYSKNIDQVRIGLLDKQRTIREYEKQLQKLKQQLGEYRNHREIPESEIYILVSSKQQLKARFNISYLTDGAGWFPSYDLRVDHIDQPVNLVYKANVFQNTGVEWKNVLLSFSNAMPDKSGNVPVPDPYYLDFIQQLPYYKSLSSSLSYSGIANGIVRDENGNPLAGVSVIVSGTSIGTITDLQGKFSLNVPPGTGLLEFNYIGYEKNIINPGQDLQVVLYEDKRALDEKVVTAFGASKKAVIADDSSVKNISGALRSVPLEVEVGEKRTSVEFRIEVPYTIPSEPKSTSIDMLTMSLPSDFRYQSVPKLDTDAFLVAKVTNWEQYDLLEGEANLYFENTFVGKSVLNTRFVSDTLDISLGRDLGVIVKREKSKDFTSRRFIGSNKIESRSWEISVRNNKKENIKIEIIDQVPVSQNKDIQVEVTELSGGILDKEKGLVSWIIDLEPGKSKSMTLSYSVKYPKDKNLVIE